MFWSDWGSFPRIERAHLDGSQRQAIVSDRIAWPNGLCVDAAAQRIYWVDARLDRLESSDFAGKSRKLLLLNAPHPFGLALVRESCFI